MTNLAEVEFKVWICLWVMNKPVYLELSISKLSKILMYEFWYDYVKPKNGNKKKTLLHGYRQFHWIHKSRLYL